MALHSEVSEVTLTASQTVAAPLLVPTVTSFSALEGDDILLSVPLASSSGVPTHVTWTRGDVELLGERFSSATQRGAVTLNVRNATVGDTGRYSLSARNDAGHAHSDLLLEVRTRPGDVPVFLRRLNDLAVKVGTRTRFLVEIRSPTQVKVSWEQEGKPVVESERFHLLHEGNFFCVDVAPVTLGDAGLWICRAHNSNGTATCFCHLNVLVPKAYKAPHFLEELVAILTEQGTVSLECKVVGVPTPTLRWFKDNQEIKAGDVFALSANPKDTTSLGTYTCEATNCMGHAYSTSRVHVLSKEGSVQPVESLVPQGPAPVFSKELRNDKLKIGGKLSLSCKVSVPPWPKNITWFNKAGMVESGGRYHIIEDGLGAYSVEVDPVEACDEGEWKCVATSDHGVKGISTCNVCVSYPKNYKKPKFLESLKAILTEEGLVSFECKVVGYPTPQLRWFKDGQELKPGDVYQLTGTNSLGSYCCIAKNCMGEASSTAELTVEDIQSQLNDEERLQLFSKNQPPRFLQGLKSLEAKLMDPLKFTVQVSVSPQPSVAWYRDDEEVQESDRYKKEQETKGYCHLTIKRLELMDQAEWKCVATNDYGQSVTSCFLRLAVPRHYKKPRFLENLRAVLSEEGAVNLECKVIGVPQPTLKWYKDGRELKPGDIHRIISGQDGTCCLGTYTCEATNCMGTVSSSASLLGFEDRAQVKPQTEPLRPLPPPAAHLVRHPSLSTIHEERTSQLHDTIASDERAEVSFSFDGKEVSVSLYETPDLTEEEALQVVEMYAEELSEHISEHNVVELPPMRFVKETSQSGHILMEAVVIDVSPEYYASAEDRTEADLDEFSITDDNGFMSPQVLTPEEMPFDKFTSDFLERTVQTGQKSVPTKPPRKRGADNSESSYHSLKEAKLTPEEESSEFADALSSIKDKSHKENDSSAKKSVIEETGGKPADEIHAELEPKKSKDPSLQLKDDKSDRKPRKKSRSRSKSAEVQPVENVLDATSENLSTKRPLKKRRSTDSEKEDDSLREFERQKSLQAEPDQGKEVGNLKSKIKIKKSKSSESEKEDDSLQEFESRKSFHQIEKESETKTTTKSKTKLSKKQLSDSSGREDDSLIEYEKKKVLSDATCEKSLKSEKQDRQKASLSKSISTDSSEKDEAYAVSNEQSEHSRKRKKRSIKKSSSTENKNQTSGTNVEIHQSSEAESCDRESIKNKKVISTSDLDRMRSTSDLDSIGDKSRAQEEEEYSADFDTAEDSAYDKSEMSVLESLTHSVKEIKKGLAAVEEKIISESTDEPQSAKSSLSAIESLVQPINEIQRGLIKVEKQAEETEAGQYSPSSILETLKEPIQELGRNLAEIERAKTAESDNESLLKRTSQTLLETMSQPLQELQKELTFIQKQAIIETGEETYSDVLQSFKPSLLVVQGGMEQTEGDFTSKIEDLTDITVIPQGTFAQLMSQEAHDKENNVFVPSTVQDLEVSLAETAVSLTTLGTFDLHNELVVLSEKIGKCSRALNEKSENTIDGEVKDILISLGQLVTPLEQFKNVIERCFRLVDENDMSNNPQVRSSNMVLKATLESPVHALGKCLNLLETVSNSKSGEEIRGLGIKILYKLSFPLEELKTTMKLTENLSEHTSIELLVSPVENLIAAASVINSEASKSGFAENIPEDGGFIVRELHDSVEVLLMSVEQITKSLSSQSSLHNLFSLLKPLADLQNSLHKMENQIKALDKHNTVNTSEIYNLAQELCKPLQAIRTELSIAQHEIELDQYSHLSLLSDSIQDNTTEFATHVVHQSLEQVLKSVLTCTEFILSKSPSETLYVRYLLFALNELILPVNQFNSSISKAEECLSRDTQKVSEPNIGISTVTSSFSELLNTLSELRFHSSTAFGLPEIQMIRLLCTMEEPLLQVERGLCKVIEHTPLEDKNVLNINMLKTLAEPLKCLQKSLINIYEKLGSESTSLGIILELRHPIQELQRSILVIQDQVSFEYGDEPASMESNIVTLQSLVHPLNALKKLFIDLDALMIDKSQSTGHSKQNENLHSIIKLSHDIQLKLSSIMVEENYINKHSLDSLDMFPIFQDLSSLLRDFENAFRRVNLICQSEAKPDMDVYNKLCEAVNSIKNENTDFLNKITLASNKAIKDEKHPVHFLKTGSEVFIAQFSEIAKDLDVCQLDKLSLASCNLKFYQGLQENLVNFMEFIKELEKVSEQPVRDTTDTSLLSSSDTIKDINTLMEEVTQTRVSLESVNPDSFKKATFEKAQKEIKKFCELLKSVEETIINSAVTKQNVFRSDEESKRTNLINTCNSMVEQLHKIEGYVSGNQEALESTILLKNTVDVIQEHLRTGSEVSEVDILQKLSMPFKLFKDTISKESNKINVSLETTPVSSYLERFEKSASDLELGLMKLEHALLNSTGDFSSLKNIDIDVIAHPIKELVCYIDKIEEKQNTLSLSETLVEQSSLSMLKTLAQPIREIQEGVLLIQEQITLEASGKTPSGKSCAGILYEIAKPIRELRSGVALIQEQIVLEPDVETLSEETKASSLQTFAAPIEEMKKVLLTISEQQPLIFEADVQSMSENISLLKTIAQPVKELQNKLASVEINQIMESDVEPFSVKENILALAKPVQTLQESIAWVESQMTLETTGEDISLYNSVSMLKELAKPLLEISKGIAIIFEQQFIEEGNLEDVPSVSEVSTLANITDVSLSGAAVHVGEIVMLEQGISFKDDSLVPQLAKSTLEENLKLGITEQQQFIEEGNLEDVASMSENSTLANITDVSLGDAAVHVGETVMIEQGISFKNDSLVPQLAKATLEENLNLGIIEQQQFIEEGNLEEVVSVSEKSTLANITDVSLSGAAVHVGEIVMLEQGISFKDDSLVPQLAKSTLEENLKLGITEQQQFIEEGNLEDVASMSENSTLANITDVSLGNGAVHVGETVMLEQGISFKDDSVVPQLAKTTLEENLNLGIIEQQQVLTEIDGQLKNKTEDALKYEKISPTDITVAHELTSSVQVQEQEVLSHAKTLSMSEEKTLLVAEPTRESLNIAVQGEFQDTLVQADTLSVESRSKENALVKDVSLNIIAQVGVQESHSDAKQLTSNEDLPLTEVLPETLTRCIVQGEFQQSLADVESLETEEDTLESISIQDVPFKFEPQISDIQQILSNVEDLLVTENTPCLAEIKTSVTEAINNESLQILDKEVSLKSVERHSEDANISFNTPNAAAETEIQQMISNVEHMEIAKNPSESATFGEMPLQCAFQVESQQVLSNVDSFKDAVSEKYSQTTMMKESNLKDVAVKTQVQQFFSVVEQIETATNELKANIAYEPLIDKALKEEVQQVLQVAKELISLKEGIEKTSKENTNVTIEPPNITQVLSACEKVKCLKETLQDKSTEHPEIEKGVENILLLAQSLETADITFVQPDWKSQEQELSTSNVILAEEPPTNKPTFTNSKDVLETQLQEFICAVEDVSHFTETLEAKIINEPTINHTVQQELKDIFATVSEIKTAKGMLEATVNQEEFKIPSEVEIQQVLLLCNSIDNLKDSVQAKLSKEVKVYSAIESELQQILLSVEAFQTVKHSLTANMKEIESQYSVASVLVQNVISLKETDSESKTMSSNDFHQDENEKPDELGKEMSAQFEFSNNQKEQETDYSKDKDKSHVQSKTAESHMTSTEVTIDKTEKESEISKECVDIEIGSSEKPADDDLKDKKLLDKVKDDINIDILKEKQDEDEVKATVKSVNEPNRVITGAKDEGIKADKTLDVAKAREVAGRKPENMTNLKEENKIVLKTATDTVKVEEVVVECGSQLVNMMDKPKTDSDVKIKDINASEQNKETAVKPEEATNISVERDGGYKETNVEQIKIFSEIQSPETESTKTENSETMKMTLPFEEAEKIKQAKKIIHDREEIEKTFADQTETIKESETQFTDNKMGVSKVVEASKEVEKHENTKKRSKKVNNKDTGDSSDEKTADKKQTQVETKEVKKIDTSSDEKTADKKQTQVETKEVKKIDTTSNEKTADKKQTQVETKEVKKIDTTSDEKTADKKQKQVETKEVKKIDTTNDEKTADKKQTQVETKEVKKIDTSCDEKTADKKQTQVETKEVKKIDTTSDEKTADKKQKQVETKEVKKIDTTNDEKTADKKQTQVETKEVKKIDTSCDEKTADKKQTQVETKEVKKIDTTSDEKTADKKQTQVETKEIKKIDTPSEMKTADKKQTQVETKEAKKIDTEELSKKCKTESEEVKGKATVEVSVESKLEKTEETSSQVMVISYSKEEDSIDKGVSRNISKIQKEKGLQDEQKAKEVQLNTNDKSSKGKPDTYLKKGECKEIEIEKVQQGSVSETATDDKKTDKITDATIQSKPAYMGDSEFEVEANNKKTIVENEVTKTTTEVNKVEGVKTEKGVNKTTSEKDEKSKESSEKTSSKSSKAITVSEQSETKDKAEEVANSKKVGKSNQGNKEAVSEVVIEKSDTKINKTDNSTEEMVEIKSESTVAEKELDLQNDQQKNKISVDSDIMRPTNKIDSNKEEKNKTETKATKIPEKGKIVTDLQIDEKDKEVSVLNESETIQTGISEEEATSKIKDDTEIKSTKKSKKSKQEAFSETLSLKKSDTTSNNEVKEIDKLKDEFLDTKVETKSVTGVATEVIQNKDVQNDQPKDKISPDTDKKIKAKKSSKQVELSKLESNVIEKAQKEEHERDEKIKEGRKSDKENDKTQTEDKISLLKKSELVNKETTEGEDNSEVTKGNSDTQIKITEITKNAKGDPTSETMSVNKSDPTINNKVGNNSKEKTQCTEEKIEAKAVSTIAKVEISETNIQANQPKQKISSDPDTDIKAKDETKSDKEQKKTENKPTKTSEVKKERKHSVAEAEEAKQSAKRDYEIEPDSEVSKMSKSESVTKDQIQDKTSSGVTKDSIQSKESKSKKADDISLAKETETIKDASSKKAELLSKTMDEIKVKNTEKQLVTSVIENSTQQAHVFDTVKDSDIEDKSRTQFSGDKTGNMHSQDTISKMKTSKKQRDKSTLQETNKDDSKVKGTLSKNQDHLEETLFVVEKEESKHKLYLDDSSTSDYGSESYSEPYHITKSKSYDTRQWVHDDKTGVDDTSSRVSSKLIRERKHEESGSTEADKISYTCRQNTSKPLFCGRLVDRTAAQGSRLKITCSLTGSPDPTVQWFKEGHAVDTSLDHRYRTRLSNGLASLEIVEAKVGDSGKYTCVARNPHGEASTTANIKVFSYMESAPEAPVFTQHIRDHYKSTSDELVIECRVKGHPLPSVVWTKNGQPLRSVSRYEQSVLTDGTCRLVVHGPEPADSGLYKCVAENAVWSEQTSANVTFEGREKYMADSRSLTDLKLPRFTNILSDTTVREGGTVALQVAVKGTPRAEVTWYRGSQPLPKRSSRFRYLEDAGVYSLVMTEASSSEAGTYTCRASNAHGYRDTSVNVEIVGTTGGSGTARGKPAMFISRPDTSMSIAVGEDVSFSFRVSGDPKPRVTWMKGMKDITNNIRTLKETVNDYVRLTLKHATVMDAGTYFLMAKNIYGADHAFVTVRVKQRARSLTPTRATIWSGPDTSTILRDIHESTKALVNDVPGPISSAPVVSDCGKNWLSLSWGKPEHRGAAPVLAYRVEAWLLGTEGGAQWNELGVTPINSFDVFFLKPGSEYKFRVTARNRYGWGESVTTTEPISVGSVANFPPDIVRDLPGPLKALQGDNVTLECEISGDPPPTIQWLRDGQNVGTLATLKGRVFVSDDQLIHRLIIKQLTEDDSGRYVCEAVNKVGRASTYARLLVVSDPRLLDADRKLKESLAEQQESAPQFTMRLRDRRVQASYPVRLSCQVVGSPTPTITWFSHGQPITADDRHQIVQEADHFHTLEICRTLLEDTGEYTATAQNCLGAVSCHSQLVVDKGIRAYVSPEFISELIPAVTVREGAELRLFAQVEAYPTVSISWQRDGVRLRPSRRLVMTLDPEGRVELALAHLTVKDAGLYTCSAANAVGRAETVCQVFVTGGTPAATEVPTITTSNVPYSKEPRFVTKPRSSEAVEGDTVVITCEVVGDPQPEVMWLRDWLKPGYYRDAPQFRQVGGGSQYSLEIPQVKLDFTGTYCVIARNPHGETKAIISLQIYAKGQGKESSMVSGHVKHGQVETLPEIKRELKDLRCCDGDSVTLECLVTATPLPSVRWEKDGKILPLGEDIEAELDGEIARLKIKKVYPEDEGQYSCVAYNNLGRAVTSACLVVDVPEEKDTLLSQQLTRPPGLLSARSTPRSTPRNTPSPARSLSPTPARFREFSSPSFSRPKRVKMSSPKFYTVPHNRIAEEGETVRFQCSVAGHPTPWASWDKDGHIVTPSSRLSVTERDDLRTLELREVTVEDAGLYRVTLENEMGSIEATARLDIIGRQGSRTRSVRAWSAVRSSPTFGRRLVGSAARVGGTFTLTCDVHASPSPVTSWYRNGEMLVMSSRVIPTWDGRRARLELRSLQPEDAGVYTCVAENAVGTTQCSAELRVLQTTDPSDADLQPPVFLQGLSPEQTAAEGQPFELQVRLQGSSPLEVVWVKDGVEVPDCPDLRHVDYGDGRFGLRIADVFVADGGIYNCEAFNDHGDAITSGHLIVNDISGGEGGSSEPEIVFTKTPSPVLARLRGHASFCARLQSRPLCHTSFTWTVNGRSVNNDDRFTVTTEDDCSVLHVGEVHSCDMGTVMCTARVCSPGVPPTTVSCDTTLGLDPTPGASAELLRGPCDTTAMRGDRVLLKATYRGDPEPSVRWLKGGRELSSEGRVQITSRDGVSCLTISAIDADDSGKYVVSVENIHGADCHFASVAVEGPPEAPAARPSVSSAGVGPGCVTVAWSSPPYDGGCVITGYSVEMRTALSHQWSVVADRCHSLSHVVRGLTPGQTYLFRVRAENIHGASESSIESFPFMLQSPHSGLREEEGEGEGEGDMETVVEQRLVTLQPGDQFLERYSVHEELGKGRYGVVHKVTDLQTGHTMAAKFVRCIKKQDREKVQEEIDIMNCLRHPKLLQLAAAFDNPKDTVMVMEYISGGELFERVVADDFTLTERDCILFLRQICEGVRYMHTCNVVHLDLKPENIMCHTRTSHRVKIIDFGLAQKLESNTPVRVLFGTPEFIPPEIINYEPIGVESDMWSVGVICYVLLSGLSPFMGDNDAETFANITRADFDFDDEAFEAISQDSKDFISSLLVKRKEKRLTAEECLKHRWLTQSDTTMSSVKLCTDKLKKFIIRRKWQKTGNAIRALGRMATLSAASRRNSSASSPSSPRPSLSASRMSSLGEEGRGDQDRARGRVCSERSDSGISDCSSINTSASPCHNHLLSKKYSICEEPENDLSRCRLTEHGVSVNKLCDGVNGKVTSDVSVAAKKRTTNSLRPDSEPAKAHSPTLQKDAKLFGKSDNFQKAFAFWKQ